MNKTEILEQVRITCRMRRLSYHTEQSYSGWIARFIAFILQPATKGLSREARLAKYLEHLAPRSSASTQNQALNAIQANTLTPGPHLGGFTLRVLPLSASPHLKVSPSSLL